MRIYIDTRVCCGSVCAYVIRGEGHWHERFDSSNKLAERHDYDAYRKYAATNDPAEEYKIQWQSWSASIQEMLAELVERKVITASEGFGAYNQWLAGHPVIREKFEPAKVEVEQE